MRAVLDAESPSLAVITGNVVAGNAWDGTDTDWFATQYAKMTDVL